MSDTVVEKNYDVRRYDLGCYDKHFCLKPPALLMLLVVFACRDFLLPVIVGVSSIKGGGGGTMDLVISMRQPYWYLTGLPALLVFYGMVRRVPSGDVIARRPWRHGRVLLSMSILLGMAPQLHTLPDRMGLLNDHALQTLLILVLNAGALAYLWLSKRVGDVFRDFPTAVS